MYRLGFVLTMLLLLMVVSMASVSTGANPNTSLRVPLFITPLRSLPQPLDNSSNFYRDTKREEFFSKVTVWDVWQSSNISIHRLLNSSVINIINLANKLYEDRVLIPAELRVHDCKRYCYVMDLDEISSITHHNKSYLTGKSSPAITLGQLHDTVVKTMETVFCFSMRRIEESLGIPSVNVTEKEWSYFVSQIVQYAIKCRADSLEVKTYEMAELVKRNESTLFAYDLEMLKYDFISLYENILKKKDVFEQQQISRIFAAEDGEGSTLSDSENWLSQPLYAYIALATNFSIRDMEILYRWLPSQLYALEVIPIQSYGSCRGIFLERTMYNISQVVMAVNDQLISDCPVSLVLARSIGYVQNIIPELTNAINQSVLGIFTKATEINSWFEIADILELGYEDGIYVDAPRIKEIVKYENISRRYIESLSIPQIITEYLSDMRTDILVKNYQPIFRQMLSTYGFSIRELLDATGISKVQLDEISIPSVHYLVLDTIIRRYRINNFTSLINFPNTFEADLNTTSTLPSSEWKQIVNATIKASFHQTAAAFFGNLQETPDGIKIIPLRDWFQSISTTRSISYRDYNINDLASCLLNKTIISISTMSFAEYHRFYNHTLVDKMQKKIAFETRSLTSLLALSGTSLGNINDKSLLGTINQLVGLNELEIECLYGRSTLSALTGGITWGEVGETRLCQPLEDRSLYNITMDLKQAPVTQCGMYPLLSWLKPRKICVLQDLPVPVGFV